MRSQDIIVDVTGQVDIEGSLVVAATVHLPDEASVPNVVAIGLPGGGYNRTYYDLHIDGLDNYSQAEFHTSRGWVFVACDTIGVGDSSPSPRHLTIFDVAKVQDAAVREFRKRLAAGTLAEGLPAAPSARLIGLGQSMGGCFTLATQGNHGSYDAVGVLGYSALHTQLPERSGAFAQIPESDERDADAQAAVQAALMESMRFAFHWEDVPAQIVDADLASVPVRGGDDVASWGKGAAPLPCGIDMLTPGIVSEQAAAITTPVLVAVGVRDVVPHPRSEPSAFTGSGDITVYVAPTMAHMHNFASTREQFWARIQTWGDAIGA